jgi:predicted Rossmann-fold nucleotide-binding protein
MVITTHAITGHEESFTARSLVDLYAKEDVTTLWQFEHEKGEYRSNAVAGQIREHAATHPMAMIFGGVSPPRLPGVLDTALGDIMRRRHVAMLEELGRSLAAHEHGIVTGACPGASEIVQRVHMETRQHARCVSVGVHRNGLKTEQVPHTHLDVLLDCGTFGPRLAMMWRLSDFSINLRGGIGSALELMYFIQKNQRTGRIVPMYVQSGTDFRILSNWIRILQRKGYVETNLRLPLYHCDPLAVPARVRDDLRRIRGT